MDNTSDLFEAISKGDLPAVDSLLVENPRLASVRNENGISTVLIALYQQQPAIADRLLAEKP